ncbi:MAG: TonB-dependent receptor, partial [Paraglaciecola sp.]|nr:TonB-dependent receptor [Paraglaciecola sp.]
MKIPTSARLRRSSYGVMLALGCVTSLSAYAQENANVLEEEADEVVEKVVITGSRIKRAEFSNASPIQIISGDVSREMGLFDASEILQTTSQTTGQQIDNSFGGFVLDNGPGSATVGFRGLGADRTLVLINGRRVAPAGVGGAPVAADLNLIPAIMIQRIENLFDGASTVYGSDAIAGVSNIILKSDVDGFDFQANVSAPKGGGGEEATLSAMYGFTKDKLFVTVGAEYYDRKPMTFADNQFVSKCDSWYYEDTNGNILTTDKSNLLTTTPESTCNETRSINWGSPFGPLGTLRATPGYTNVGIPGWSGDYAPVSAIGVRDNVIGVDRDGDGINDSAIYDGNGDGLIDFDTQDPFYAADGSDYQRSGYFVSPVKRKSVFLNGQYDFGDANDTALFFEGLYAGRSSNTFNPRAQFFPYVSADNPYNPCGSDEINGVNCNAILGRDRTFYEVRPIVGIRGDRSFSEVDVYQLRAVVGLRGNIGLLDSFGQGDWSYETNIAYSYSNGKTKLSGIGTETLAQSLDAVRNEDGSISCVDESNGCVAVNLFAPNIYQAGGGMLTAEEQDFLFVDRTMETIIKQTMWSGFVTGNLFSLPWNNQIVPLVVGAEFRKDEIVSNPNDVSADGLMWGFSGDQGADGSRNLREAFLETEFPLLRGVKFAEELTLTASGRWTDETFYDPETTYSLKGVYRPTDWFTLRGTKGTSYRAPNLRERFLNGTSGFSSVVDPCVVPTLAREDDGADGQVYVAAEDTRDQRVFTSCAASGIDAKSFGLGTPDTRFSDIVSARVTTGGTENLFAEKSLSKTYGFVVEQPFTDKFDLTFSLTNYDISITNSIEEPDAPYIISSCYNNENAPNGESSFCSLIVRDANNRMTGVDSSFVNVGLITSVGVDYNLYYNQEFVVGSETLGVSFDLLGTKMKEQYFQILDEEDDNAFEPAFPKWRINGRLSLDYGDFRFNWVTRYIGDGEPDTEDAYGNSSPCYEVVEAGTTAGPGCRPIAGTPSYVLHNASLVYQ